ncbi:polysaccharide biosynthesis protein [Rubellimicrobium rubrum]|uniref:Polysaccharide biosynthesis protein n=1 Tax=Rubellimicrobium rubrum TaxID=2585369 RepID=A0A5C4MKA2_9RHOB|nr:oligosaccharide flippase family protein [Rubellimicrobium rubrum]TNC44693.1 polysaccharide biosynthesis protein [Rubellimicrobium rubrum]
MVRGLIGGTGLGVRLIRSSGLIFLGFSASQAIRLGSNLILTRLLYPEAFGLMALIIVFLVGLTMLSDIGIAPSIQQSSRGDDRSFINTAWTIQVIRGVILWLICCLLGVIAAWGYGEDQLRAMLPVAGLSLLISGFDPTRIETASRHLSMGRLTVLDLLAQVVGLAALLILVWIMGSAWALVIGGVLSSLIRLVIMHTLLPGQANWFHWERDAAVELITFGKWIFLSTLCGFIIIQGDKAILGKYLSLEALGIYNIGYFLAGFPQALAGAVMSRVMIPLHRECPPGTSAENYAKVRKSRALMTATVLTMQFVMAFFGVWLVELMYDQRFVAAGSVVTAIACMNIPYLIGMTYEYAALGRGDSRGLFHLLLPKAMGQTILFILGLSYYGLPGALAGVWLSQIITHTLVIRLARQHGAWDPWHDLIYGMLGLILTGLALWYHWGELALLGTFSTAQ